jgi:hypothetical protein
VDIAVVVNGKSLQVRGAGECKHEPDASIYNAPASLWRVEYRDSNGADIQEQTKGSGVFIVLRPRLRNRRCAGLHLFVIIWQENDAVRVEALIL